MKPSPHRHYVVFEPVSLVGPPFQEGGFREVEVRGLVKLMALAAAERGGIEAKRRILLTGLGAMLRADSWLQYREEPVDWQAGGECALPMPGWLHGAMGRMQPERLEVVAHVADGSFLFFLTRRPDSGVRSVTGFQRRGEKGGFSDREKRIAEVILSEVRWLHGNGGSGLPAGFSGKLSPRQKEVALLLGKGWSRKTIAARLGVTEHTLNGYVKLVFRHYQVHSQSGLQALLSRDARF